MKTLQLQQNIQMSIISSVSSSYALILDLKNRLDISEKTLISRDSALLIIQAKYDGGIIPQIDLNQAQINND